LTPVFVLLAALEAALALSACGGGGGAAALPLGEEAVAGYGERNDAGAYTGVRTTLGITVLAVRKGTQDDLTKAGFEVDEDARDSTPYYVDVRYENQGQATVERNFSVSLEDEDGNLLPSTLIFNFGDRPFEPCEAVKEGKLAPGESYESCTLVLVPEGADVGQVSYLSDNGPDKEPEFLYWDAG
jgi:hypothetical protein